MGKKKAVGKRYLHKHTYNAKARESDERKIELLQSMEVKRLQKQVDKIKAEMRVYIPSDARKRPKIGANCYWKKWESVGLRVQ